MLGLPIGHLIAEGGLFAPAIGTQARGGLPPQQGVGQTRGAGDLRFKGGEDVGDAGRRAGEVVQLLPIAQQVGADGAAGEAVGLEPLAELVLTTGGEHAGQPRQLVRHHVEVVEDVSGRLLAGLPTLEDVPDQVDHRDAPPLPFLL